MKFCPDCSSPLALKIIDERDRLACERDCGFVYWNNPIPVVAALIKIGDTFVLARNAAWPVGSFSLISGFLEAGEGPKSAIARETKEELGLDFKGAEFIGHYPFAQMNQLILAYVVEASGTISKNDEIADIKYLTLDELKSYDFGVLKLGALVVKDWLQKSA